MHDVSSQALAGLGVPAVELDRWQALRQGALMREMAQQQVTLGGVRPSNNSFGLHDGKDIQ